LSLTLYSQGCPSHVQNLRLKFHTGGDCLALSCVKISLPKAPVNSVSSTNLLSIRLSVATTSFERTGPRERALGNPTSGWSPAWYNPISNHALSLTCNPLYDTVPFHTTLYYIIPYHTILCHVVLDRATSYYIGPWCTIVVGMLSWLELVSEHLMGRQGQPRGTQVYVVPLSDWKEGSQDLPLPRPHLRSSCVPAAF